MRLADLEMVCDENAGFVECQFRLRLQFLPLTHAAQSFASDIDTNTRDEIQRLLTAAFAKAITLLKNAQPVPRRRDTDINTTGASTEQNP
jgi:hypothetical protein